MLNKNVLISVLKKENAVFFRVDFIGKRSFFQKKRNPLFEKITIKYVCFKKTIYSLLM